jgi:phosphate transport system protein
MQDHFTQEVDSLKTSLIKMASLVDEQVEQAIKALETGDINLCKGIKAKDLEVDAYDNLIQTQCENILALFHPIATDLRFIISSMMVNNQLERCGDIAVNISKRVKRTSEYNALIKESGILEMALKAKTMLKSVIDSFIQINTEIANSVLFADEAVDEMNRNIFQFLIDKMQAEPALIEPCSHLIVLARHIERLADHSTNIAENVIFYTDSRIVSHIKKFQRYQYKGESE